MKKLIVLCLGLLVLSSACSTGSSSSKKNANDKGATTLAANSSSPTIATEPMDPKLEAAAKSYIQAFLVGNADGVWNLYSSRCQQKVNKNDLAAFVKKSSKDYQGAKLVDVQAIINGDQALVNYNMSKASLTRHAQAWKREKGLWRNNQC